MKNMNNINIYNAARRDIKLNDFPRYNEDGTYKFNQGQLFELNQVEFQQISAINVQIDQQGNKARALRKEIIAFQSPADKMIADGEKEKNSYSVEIEEEQDNQKILKADRRQYIDDMMIRGYIPAETNSLPEQEKQPEPKPRRKLINWKAGLSFLLIWGTGEVFMTYVQYNSLRYEKGIENIIARSIAFAVVLFLIHYVAHINKIHRRRVYTIFLVFSFLMIFSMLFAPLILNQLYPESNGIAVAQQWSINSTGTATTTKQITNSPFLVELYRKNDMIPGILSFLFFLIMSSLVKKEKKQVADIQAVQTETTLVPVQDEVSRKIDYYDNEIRRSEARLAEIRNAQKLSLHPTTDSLYNILKTLKDKQQQELSCIETRDRLITKRQLLLNEVLSNLGKYQLEFIEALNNDPVKCSFVRPSWPVETDIINHYKNKAI